MFFKHCRVWAKDERFCMCVSELFEEQWKVPFWPNSVAYHFEVPQGLYE
jgi:hypothetical protein